MISDVPALNLWHRARHGQPQSEFQRRPRTTSTAIGTILEEWENNPFYGWARRQLPRPGLIPLLGYAMTHATEMSPKLIEDFAGLARLGYPYIRCVGWSGTATTPCPEPSICDFIRDWNEKHVSPRFVISVNADASAPLSSATAPSAQREGY